MYIAYVDISDEAYQMLESMKGSVWICEACDDNFEDLQKKLDILSSENDVLRARLKDLEELPRMVKSLHSQVESRAKDLDFMLNGTDGSDTPVMGRKLAPNISTSNSFAILGQHSQFTAHEPVSPPAAEAALPLLYHPCEIVKLANPTTPPMRRKGTKPGNKRTSNSHMNPNVSPL